MKHFVMTHKRVVANIACIPGHTIHVECWACLKSLLQLNSYFVNATRNIPSFPLKT